MTNMEAFRREMALDGAAEADRIGRAIVAQLTGPLRRRGVVLGVSGGVDSAVCASLAVRALGPDRVFGLLMPERDCPSDDRQRGEALCRRLGIAYAEEDITDALAALGCYARRDAAIRGLFPDYDTGWRQKIVLGNDPLQDDRLPYFDLVAEAPNGETRRARMPADVYLQVVAATNMKQRVRKLIECYHAERLNYAVLGTPNRLEYELGFFVRGGDGLADLKPIAHLYKSQVYALAEQLGVPEDIRRQPPSTATYSLQQTQQEFYFGLPWQAVDRLLWALWAKVPAEAVGHDLGLSAAQVERAWRDIAGKRRMAARSLAGALLVEPVGGDPDQHS